LKCHLQFRQFGTCTALSWVRQKLLAISPEQRRAEEQQKLLIREMNHRIKNLFALALGLVTATWRSARSPEDFARSLRERIAALARAHELTLPNHDDAPQRSEHPTTLEMLLKTIFGPYSDKGRPERIKIGGPPVEIAGRELTSIALLFHELATNAAKYGALSVPKGRLSVRWTLNPSDIDIIWEERDGPTIEVPPVSVGFGTKLSEATITGQLGGKVTRQWFREGLILRMTIPKEVTQTPLS
jgi:two-component sensor histidine kinase